LSRLLVLADREGVRLAGAIVVAALLCLGLLSRSAGWFAIREAAPRAPTTIEMRLVEIAPPTPAPPVAPVVHATSAPPPAATTRAVQRAQPRSTHVAPHSNSVPAQPAPEEARVPTEPAPHEEQAATPAPAATSVAQSASNSPASSNGTSSTAPSAPSGSTQARLLSQPMPVLPDDLREQGYQVTAVARFKVHADGSFDVELVKPTQNPRLNQILLDTLHRWRFFPAMENGHPVESDQEVRVHFSVS
jgi:protein TonB